MARITRLEVQNMYRIKAVSIKFSKENGVFIIGGRNEQGKSSTIDSLWSVLKGKGVLKKEPVRSGAEEGHTTLTLDNGLTVTRRVRPGGWTDIVVENEEGATFKSPQTLLGKLFGEYLDPVELSRMNDKELQAMLEQLAGLDYSTLDAKRTELYSDRAVVNKDQKRLQATAEGMEKHEGIPAEPPSTGELVDQIQKGNEHNQDITDIVGELAGLDEELEHLAGELMDKKNDYRHAQEKAKALGQPIDVATLKERLASIEDLQWKFRDNEDRSAKFLEARGSKHESEQITAQIQEVDAEKARMLAEAKLPVEGLSFGDSGVLYKGVPIEQESTSSRLTIFTPMLISMLPPAEEGVRLLFIRDGNVLDDDNKKLIADFAEKEDVLVLMEVVTTDPSKASIIIEDGMVAEEGTV